MILVTDSLCLAGNYRSALNDCVSACKFTEGHMKAITKGNLHIVCDT